MSESIAELRAIVTAMPPAPEGLGAYLAKVKESAYTITDSEVEQLKATGFSEDEILEADVPERDVLIARAPLMHDGGYDLGAVLTRA